jgi:hypothetical protein
VNGECVAQFCDVLHWLCTPKERNNRNNRNNEEKQTKENSLNTRTSIAARILRRNPVPGFHSLFFSERDELRNQNSESDPEKCLNKPARQSYQWQQVGGLE